MFYLMIGIGMLCVGVIGYLIGWDRGYRETHERIVANQLTQRKPRKQQSYTSEIKQLHLVKSKDPRE
jgi:hypothetical protein